MPDLSQLVTRIASSLQITYADASELARRMAPVLVVESLDDIGDSADVATRYCWRGGTMISTAGNFSAVGLVNPADSGVRIVMTAFTGGLLQTSTLSMGKGATVAGTIAQGRYRDGGPGTPSGQLETIATAGVTVDDIIWLALSTVELPGFSIVIDPGENVRLQSNTANSQVRVSYLWKEIKLPVLL